MTDAPLGSKAIPTPMRPEERHSPTRHRRKDAAPATRGKPRGDAARVMRSTTRTERSTTRTERSTTRSERGTALAGERAANAPPRRLAPRPAPLVPRCDQKCVRYIPFVPHSAVQVEMIMNMSVTRLEELVEEGWMWHMRTRGRWDGQVSGRTRTGQRRDCGADGTV